VLVQLKSFRPRNPTRSRYLGSDVNTDCYVVDRVNFFFEWVTVAFAHNPLEVSLGHTHGCIDDVGWQPSALIIITLVVHHRARQTRVCWRNIQRIERRLICSEQTTVAKFLQIHHAFQLRQFVDAAPSRRER
jgi:hypothetical protein